MLYFALFDETNLHICQFCISENGGACCTRIGPQTGCKSLRQLLFYIGHALLNLFYSFDSNLQKNAKFVSLAKMRYGNGMNMILGLEQVSNMI